ncbi:MAG: hypothetical protein RL693_1779, partial [Verrucomicrobiota bacterium]
PEDYVHRIGRTGRAQAIGDAISFVTPYDRNLLNNLEHFIGRGLVRKKAAGFNYELTAAQVGDNEPPTRRGERSQLKTPVTKDAASGPKRMAAPHAGDRPNDKKRTVDAQGSGSFRGTAPRAPHPPKQSSSAPKRKDFKVSPVTQKSRQPGAKKQATRNKNDRDAGGDSSRGENKNSKGKKFTGPKQAPVGFWSNAPHHKGGSTRVKKNKGQR